jgi:hypothetical protein
MKMAGSDTSDIALSGFITAAVFLRDVASK